MINTAYCEYCKKQTAAKKCCNHALHAVLTICTGVWIIIWILAILADNNYRCMECGKKVKLGSIEPSFHCPRCKAVVEKDAIFCPHCGTVIEKLCKQCNAKNELNSLFCKKCGEKLSNNEYTN